MPASANQRGRRAGTRTDVNMHKMPEPADRHVCRHARMRGCAGQRAKPRTCDCALRAGKRMSRERTQAGLARADTPMCTHVHGSARERVLGHSRGARARACGGGPGCRGRRAPPGGLGPRCGPCCASRRAARAPGGQARTGPQGRPPFPSSPSKPLCRARGSPALEVVSPSPQGLPRGPPRAVWAPRKTRGLPLGGSTSPRAHLRPQPYSRSPSAAQHPCGHWEDPV